MSNKSIEQYRNHFLKNGCDLIKTAEYAGIDERTVSRNILENLKQYEDHFENINTIPQVKMNAELISDFPSSEARKSEKFIDSPALFS